MACEQAFSVELAAALLDDAPMAAYISTSKTYELLYANRLAKNWFLCREGETVCYRAAGYDRPCPFCRMGKSDDTQVSGALGQFCRLRAKAVHWNGELAYIVYIQQPLEEILVEGRGPSMEMKLSEAFGGIPCGLCIYQYKKGHILPLFHNAAFYKIMGYSEQHIQMVKREVSYLGVHPDDMALLEQKILKIIQQDGILQHTYRLWNDTREEYRWIRLDGASRALKDGVTILYGVYSDVSEQFRLKEELAEANEKMQDIINAIPGGVVIYKVTNCFEIAYFSDGVPELIGYTVEEYRELMERGVAKTIYDEDIDMVAAKTREVLRTHQLEVFEYRKLHRSGDIVWVRVQMKWAGEENGFPLLHCVFHNISDIKEAQLTMNHLINSIPGGIASYQVEKGRFIPTYFSDGVPELSGHTREEFQAMVQQDALCIIYESDRPRVLAATKAALLSGNVLDVSYRMRHKNGNLVWIHLNGRRMGPLSDSMRFYAVFTGMSEETRLFQSIADETADGIYVIDQATYDLLYVNESKVVFHSGKGHIGQKCYAALHGKNKPCEFCTLKHYEPDGVAHELKVGDSEHFYTSRFRRTNWNGIPAYIQYVRDVTEEVLIHKEKERLEQYFQTVLKNLPGGVMVMRCGNDGRITPEYISDGFAAMAGMTVDEAWELYRQDIVAGVHPDDQACVRVQMAGYLSGGESRCEIVYRIKKGRGGYLWVKNSLSMIQNSSGEKRVYGVYHDMTSERKKQEHLRRQYNDLILQHYQAAGPDTVMIGHCNISEGKILDIIDYTKSDLLQRFGTDQDRFFNGLSAYMVDTEDRQAFLRSYCKEAMLAAFAQGSAERQSSCFMKMPGEAAGRYVQIKMNLITTPDSGDLAGILTMTDITEQTIADRILHQLSIANCDVVVDVDLLRDCYTVLTCDETAEDTPRDRQGVHSEHVAWLAHEEAVPKDRALIEKMLDGSYMLERLGQEGSYTFPYSVIGRKGEIRAKNLKVSAVDLRLGRVCLARTDITDSVREQQGLLNVVAYTFELLGIIHIASGRLTMYTRQTVLENLPPYIVEDYSGSLDHLVEFYAANEGRKEVKAHFCLQGLLKRLREKPSGFDFVFPYQASGEVRYKQVNVLWGDDNHETVCMVRADVTDMLMAERQAKNALEKALSLAEEANRAKSDFLSSMSHDIRTPMNAIMGMTALARAHVNDHARVTDYLEKISFSSKHLLSLINDILDMSKIERSQITLNRMKISLSELVNQLSGMMTPQAKAAGLRFCVHMEGVCHAFFYGDLLRINQILINILSNAIKFTPEGGQVAFEVAELPSDDGRAHYQFTVRDTGVGMTQEFLSHLFQPFTRSRNTMRVEGTGLGLSITKGLVDLMHGKISVESRPHEGTTFRVELEGDIVDDHASGDLEAARFGDPEEQTLAGRRFLVAEDNAINSEILCELLQMHGAECVIKVDGAQAVQAFTLAPPGAFDAILMDIQMPRMNGYEATRAIRGMNRNDAAQIPIIAMTANAFSEDVQASLDAGMTAHIAKPIDIQLLLAELDRVLSASQKK